MKDDEMMIVLLCQQCAYSATAKWRYLAFCKRICMYTQRRIAYGSFASAKGKPFQSRFFVACHISPFKIKKSPILHSIPCELHSPLFPHMTTTGTILDQMFV